MQVPGTRPPTPPDPSLSETRTQTAEPGTGAAHELGARIVPTPGQLFGHYRVLRRLGEGGMGEVYEAQDEENGRHVALKVVRKIPPGWTDRARFLREGRLAASISHPHVVYVFGTEEIEGVPVMATEIATGGTLRDRVVSGGPFTPGRAVDATLQLIAGLEAAADVGVLHRDVKPSNCFIDGEGRVKIGDFGLAISTDTFERADLTLPGIVLGTPAYASPEQMRGQPIDVRSDIYSVGATLHWLLVARGPFGDAHNRRGSTLEAREAPTPFGESASDVPRGLKKVVLQCLESDPKDRPQSYADLRALLQPYSFPSASAATLWLRLLAASLDLLLLDLVFRPLRVLSLVRFGAPANRLELLAWLLSVGALWIPYFGVTERVWGASPGKRLLGLRVIGAYPQSITLQQSFARAAVWWACWTLPSLLVMAMFTPELLERRSLTSPSVAFYGAIGIAVSFVSLGLLFVTARWRNGFAGLHDLVTRTRVVSNVGVQEVTRAPRPSRTVVPTGAVRIGPYAVLDASIGAAGVTPGFDERLARRVWIRQLQPGAPPLPPERRDLDRPARLRWLSGRRGEDRNWDAFEAIEGEPFLSACTRHHSWSTVRHWLLDLAREIAAMSTDKTEVPLSTAVVWVDGDRGRFVDWQPLDVDEDQRVSTKGQGNETVDWQQFLCIVAASGLNIDWSDWRSSRPFAGSPDLPLHARQFLGDLASARFQSPSEAVERLNACARLPGTLTHARRGAHLAVCGAFPILLLLLLLTLLPIVGLLRGRMVEFYELGACLRQLEALARPDLTPAASRQQTAIEVYIAGRFRGTFVSEPDKRKPWFMPLITPRHPLFQRALERHPSPSATEVEQAAQQIADLRSAAQPFAVFTWSTAPFFTWWVIMIVAAPGVVSAFAMRGGAMLRALGLAVVGPDGAEVSRPRSFYRATIAFGPILAGYPLTNGIPFGLSRADAVALVMLVLIFIAGAGFAFLHPRRGLQDRLARTYVVAR